LKFSKQNPFPAGMVSEAIPEFRLKMESLRKDIERIEKLGVKIQYNSKLTACFLPAYVLNMILCISLPVPSGSRRCQMKVKMPPEF